MCIGPLLVAVDDTGSARCRSDLGSDPGKYRQLAISPKPSSISPRPQFMTSRHDRPIGTHLHSGGVEFSYLGQDLDEVFGQPEEPIASAAVWERSTEHLHEVLSDDYGVDYAVYACPGNGTSPPPFPASLRSRSDLRQPGRIANRSGP